MHHALFVKLNLARMARLRQWPETPASNRTTEKILVMVKAVSLNFQTRRNFKPGGGEWKFSRNLVVLQKTLMRRLVLVDQAKNKKGNTQISCT